MNNRFEPLATGLAADHKRGWHDDNDMSGAGCVLCQEEETPIL